MVVQNWIRDSQKFGQILRFQFFSLTPSWSPDFFRKAKGSQSRAGRSCAVSQSLEFHRFANLHISIQLSVTSITWVLCSVSITNFFTSSIRLENLFYLLIYAHHYVKDVSLLRDVFFTCLLLKQQRKKEQCFLPPALSACQNRICFTLSLCVCNTVPVSVCVAHTSQMYIHFQGVSLMQQR